MTQMRLSTDEVAAVYGVTPKTVREWVRSGHLIPAVDGRGRGHRHEFDPDTMHPADRPARRRIKKPRHG